MRYKYLFILFLSLLIPNNEKYTLVISFDGFRHDYINRVPTPNFDRFIQNGVFSSLIPIFPSLTFPNHYSIATGSYADKHKILGNSFFSRTLNKDYSMRDSKAVQNGAFYGMEPIWVTAEKNGLLSATYFWIGSEAEINGYRPTIYKNYDGSVSFVSRVDSIVSWYKRPKDSRPNLTMLYFSEPDYAGHRYGPNTNEVNKTIIEMDSLLGYLISEISKTEVSNNLDIIIVSDHGMTSVSKDRVVILDNFLNIDDYNLILSPAIAHLWIKDTDSIELINIFKDQSQVKIYKKGDFPNKFHFSNDDAPDYIIVSDLGWTITTSARLEEKKSFPRGMHGYDSNYTDMHGIFYASGPSFKKGIRVEPFENINIYPLLCKNLKIEPYNKSIYWNNNLLENGGILK